MSHAVYDRLWQGAMESLCEVQEIENPPAPVDGKTPRNKIEERVKREDAFQHFAVLYLKYLQILRALEDSYDQIVHPQKRRHIKKYLELVMARICNVKEELVRFNPSTMSDCVDLDEYLLDMKLSTKHLEVSIPHYFTEDEDGVISMHLELIDKCYTQHGIIFSEQKDMTQISFPDMTTQQAIRIIQKNERGRQGRMRANLMKELLLEEMARKMQEADVAQEQDPIGAAKLIQKTFRGHLVRQTISSEADAELIFIGMRTGHEVSDAASKETAIRRMRKTRQIDNEMEYKKKLEELRKDVADQEGPEMKDSMWEERYNWWEEQNAKTGKYPDNFDQFYQQQSEAADNQQTTPPAEQKGAPKKSQKAPPPEKKSAPAGKKGAAVQEEIPPHDESFVMASELLGPPSHLKYLQDAILEYKTCWANLDESANPSQEYVESFAKDLLRPGVKERVRNEVDNKLLEYLENLKLRVQLKQEQEDIVRYSLAGLPIPRKKPSKKGKGKGKKGKGKKGKGKGKKGKTKKTEGEKACANMTFEDMVSYLVQMNILQKMSRNVQGLSDFVGDMSYIGSAAVDAKIRPDPSALQIRQALTEYCILPQGSAFVKNNSPLISSILLYGPKGSGKTMLSRAVASSTASMWFDLSPANVEGYVNTNKEAAKLMHMVFTVAKQFAPSVVYMDNVERVFTAQKGKKVTDNATRMRKELMLHRKSLTAEHRVLVIGNSSAPFEDFVDRKGICEFFSRKMNARSLFVPYPSYADRRLLWSKFITAKGLDLNTLTKNPSFDLASLTFVSEGYTSGGIIQAINYSLPDRRVQKMRKTGKSVDTSEFLSALAKAPYTYKANYAAFQDFTDDITGEKVRRKQLADILARRQTEEEAAGAKKGGSKR